MSESTFSQDEIRVLKALASGLLGTSLPTNGGDASLRVATDAELDASGGDPTIRNDPKRWAGDSFVGATYSQCSPEYLAVLAEALDFFASKDEKLAEPRKHRNGTPWHVYNRKDAALARGWAKRLRGGWRPTAGTRKAPESRSAVDDSNADRGHGDARGDDEIPF